MIKFFECSEQVAQIAHALAMISNKYFGGNVNADRCVTLAAIQKGYTLEDSEKIVELLDEIDIRLEKIDGEEFNQIFMQ